MTQQPAYTSPTERVQAWAEGPTLHIRFNNPERHNALSVDMWQAVPPLLRQAEQDEAIRLVVFSGAGDKAFVSGADISQFEDMRAAREAVRQYEAMAEEALMAIYHCARPTLACIRGYCIGGGVNVAISCDLRIASDDATFAIPAARLGLGYRLSALKNLVDLVGVGTAKDLFFTARRIAAAEAKSLGLITRVCPGDELDALLKEYIDALAQNAPLTVYAGKRIMQEILEPDADLDRDLCQGLIRACFESEDYAEGRRAFMEKRKPQFRGK
ncbi:enoyl-CoA hydratase [Ramlibacter monticola]|uniref:Enoyl-CoA hydratase/isomerase family protein n=1 Tax=Ramlibacter monticola TaxID=1926872 RepID=A0A936Z1K5_9BURK|nr:enoyl-CoA hydratase [Ramlibacter monticola]MBL0391882.1 enoyl-CoA hydratase/isomerase family protein [Ramlibacter monticola]